MGSAAAMTTRCPWTVESDSGVLGRNPGNQPLGWDAGRVRILLWRGVHSGGAAGVGRGNERDPREAVPVKTGSVPKHRPKFHPTPAAAPPRKSEGLPDDPPRS